MFILEVFEDKRCKTNFVRLPKSTFSLQFIQQNLKTQQEIKTVNQINTKNLLLIITKTVEHIQYTPIKQ